MCLFFFFQAEDGIRDWSVTGVQTCALPLSTSPTVVVLSLLAACADVVALSVPVARADVGLLEIGRASCRERV